MTKRKLYELLVESGLSPEAIADVLRRTGPARHRERTLAAYEAAVTWCKEKSAPLWGARELCWAEAQGLDGKDGGGTSRHEAFRGLGKGRRQASDGDAWTAAILAGARLECAPVISGNDPTAELGEFFCLALNAEQKSNLIRVCATRISANPTAWLAFLATLYRGEGKA